MERPQYPIHRAAQFNNTNQPSQPIKQNPNYNPAQPGQSYKSSDQTNRGKGEQGRR